MTDHNRSTSLYSNSAYVSEPNVSFNVYHEETRMLKARKSSTVLSRALNLYKGMNTGVRACVFTQLNANESTAYIAKTQHRAKDINA